MIKPIRVHPTAVKIGDVIVGLEDFEIPEGAPVLGREGNQIILPDSVLGTPCHLYTDQYRYLIVRREVSDEEFQLDPDAHVLISDALLLLAEQRERKGEPTVRLRAVLDQIHHFSDPSTGTDVFLRPRQ